MEKFSPSNEHSATIDEEAAFMEQVIAGDAELLYLDSYLSELFG